MDNLSNNNPNSRTMVYSKELLVHIRKYWNSKNNANFNNKKQILRKIITSHMEMTKNKINYTYFGFKYKKGN